MQKFTKNSPPQNSRSRPRGFLSKMLFAGGIAALCLFGLTLAVIANARHLLLALANHFLKGIAQIEAEELELVGAGHIRFSGLRISNPAKSGLTSVEIPAGDIFFEYQDAFAGRLRHVRIFRPRVHATIEQGRAAPPTPAQLASPRQETSAPSFSVPIIISRLTIIDGALNLDSREAHMPEIGLIFSLDVGEFSFSRTPHPPTHYLNVTNAKVTAPGTQVTLLDVPAATVGFRPIELIEDRTIASVGVVAPTVETGAAVQRMLATTEASSRPSPMVHTPSTESRKWSIKEVVIKNATVRLRDLALGLPELDFDLSAHLQDVPTQRGGGWESISGATTKKLAVIENVKIQSPFDALTPVFELGRVILEFKPVFLLRESLFENIIIERPRIYLCEDLF